MVKKLSVLITCLVLLGSSSLAAQDIAFPSNNLGVYYYEFRGSVYELDNRTTAGSGSENVIGSILFFERILSDVFTLGIKYGSGLKREMEFKVGTSDVSITETVSYQALEIKSYATSHRKSGFKPYLAVSYGSITTDTAIKTTPESGATSAEETRAVIPIKAWCVGFDYLIWKLVFRVEIGRTSGSRNDLENSASYFAKYQYDTTTVGAALAFFF